MHLVCIWRINMFLFKQSSSPWDFASNHGGWAKLEPNAAGSVGLQKCPLPTQLKSVKPEIVPPNGQLFLSCQFTRVCCQNRRYLNISPLERWIQHWLQQWFLLKLGRSKRRHRTKPSLQHRLNVKHIIVVANSSRCLMVFDGLLMVCWRFLAMLKQLELSNGRSMTSRSVHVTP